MKRTKIDWCDMSWNPVTGCFHGCEYCYAHSIATRFEGFDPWKTPDSERHITETNTGDIITLDGMQARTQKNGKVVPAAFPYGFSPTFHRYKLYEPQRVKKAKTIFVCSMADLFGNWVPDEWIEAVFAACAESPQHRYLFLTKNPVRYVTLEKSGKLPMAENMWYGTSVTTQDTEFLFGRPWRTFVSVEPLLTDFESKGRGFFETDWVIVGAETGNRKGKVTPKKEWVDHITAACKENNIPLCMKESLVPIVGERNMCRQYPW